ncbi:MAG: ABC transporter substrate-binding protein [Vulcanimicrobiaceae bacterium]
MERVPSRRTFIKAAGASTALAAGFPAFIRNFGEAADTIKIGIIDSETGTYAFPGENEIKGFHFAADMWNKRGGVMGRQLELIVEDEAGDPGVSAQKAHKLIDQDKVVALSGTISSASSLSVSGVASSAGILYIDSGGHSDDVTGKACHWSTFRTCHSTWMETHATGLSLAKRFGKKWYLITPDYAFGHALEAGYRDVLSKIGGTIVGNDLTPLGTTDFSSYLAKVEPAKPDLLIVLVQGDDFTNCLKQANSFGLLKKVPVGGPQVELEPLWGLPPEARSGFWGVEWFYKSDLTLGKGNTLAHNFVNDYTKLNNQPPTARSAFGYISLDRMATAMAEAKSTDTVKVARALEGVRFRSIFNGEAYYRKEDHQLMWPMWIAGIRPNGTPGDKYELFDVIDMVQPELIEQTVAEKAKVCTMAYP